jgi:3'-5' exoribonuclease
VAQSYKGSLQLNVKGLQKFEQDLGLGEFLPSSSGDPHKMLAELKKYAASITDPFLNELLRSFFNDKLFIQNFSNAPAAKNMHHAYIGGLLEHTLAIVRLADQVTKLYPSLERSLLICGAILHDIGKTKEFSFAAAPFDYSDEGRLVGHMVMAIEMMNEKVAHIAAFPEELAARLKHLILSHHGRHEFGSPSLPMIREAFVLNFLDDLDAKINYMDRLCSQAEGEGYQWTPYQRTLERFLFVPGHREENGAMEKAGKEPVSKDDENIKQPSLWEL